MRLPQRFLARLAEKNHAEEFDHRIARERGDERNRRGDDGDQHIEKCVGQSGRKQKALQQQPLGNESR